METHLRPSAQVFAVLSKMLKKGTWISSQARFEEWYYGEEEPV